MKILFLTTQFPYPIDNGGKHGAINGLKVIAKNNDVTVLSFTEEPFYINEGVDFFKKQFVNVNFENPIFHSIHIRKKPLKLLIVMLKGFFSKLPYLVTKFENRLMYKKIDQMFSLNNWEIVFIDYLNMWLYGEYIQKKYSNSYSLLILKDHNIEYEIVKQAANNSHGIKKNVLNREWRLTKAYEERAIKKADLVFSVCNENTSIIKEINKKSFTMLPTYESKTVYSIRKPSHRILYVGSLSWGANLDGLKWFVNRVLPKIIDKIPDAVLTVVGGGLKQNPFLYNQGVDYKGYLKDISRIYDDHTVFVVPLFEGSGIRIKILEAFDNEIAVVSTTVGCSTIEAEDGKEIIIADDEVNFALGVIELLQNEEKNKQLTINAKSFLRERFGLDKRQDEFKKIIEKEKNY